MNSLRSPRSRSRSARRTPPAKVARPELRWIYDGVRHRVTAWPEVGFEREISPDRWAAGEFAEDAFAASALGVSGSQWREFLEFVPPTERSFLLGFQFNRVAALHVMTRCPTLLADLIDAPALTAFVAAHLSLRGGSQPSWTEIEAVYEREGLFGILQWLGLPASRQTVTILQHIADPDVPRRLLEPLRAALWEPEVIWLLSHEPKLTDEKIAETCHAMAA